MCLEDREELRGGEEDDDEDVLICRGVGLKL